MRSYGIEVFSIWLELLHNNVLPEKYTVKNFILGSALKVSYRKVKSDATNVCCNWANGIFAGARQSGY